MRNVLIRSGATDYKIITLMRHTPKNIPKSIQIISIKIFPFHLNTHAGQEFNLVLEGRVEIHIGEKSLILNVGDSIYFNAQLPHGMRALDEKPMKMLAIIM